MPQLNLTDQEKQDILRYLDGDMPLPDKYRYMLFEDKSQFELVWNGMTSVRFKVALLGGDLEAGGRQGKQSID